MTTPLLEAHDLRKSYRATKAVDGVSLLVEPGEAYGLVGPDGAGKTTTMRLLVGALHSAGGDVRIMGHDLRERGSDALAQVGYLAQRFSLYGELTVAENLSFFASARSVPRAATVERSAELLAFVGLSGFEQRRAEQLSGGMKQKLGLACALIHRPRLLLLDEPTTGVDPVTRQDFWQLIIRLMSGGVGVVVSTPYMDEASRCSRLGFMYAGRIVELVAQPKHIARDICLEDPDVENVVAFGDRLHLRLRDANCAGTGAGPCERLPLTLAAAGVQVDAIRMIPSSLEDVFISLLEREAQRAAPEAIHG